MNAPFEQLREICDEILFSGADQGRQIKACNELYQFCVQMTGSAMDSDEATDSQITILPNGKAIAPQQAAFCILEFKRTTQFLRGVYAALIELKKRFPDERIEVVYAGCGPFGTLIVPLLTQFRPAELGVTFIDIHARSLNAIRDVLQKIGLTAFADDFVQRDATLYQHKKPPHLVMTETMQAALKTEPQVAVTQNLSPQVIENGFFIPQKITVEACLANLRGEVFSADAVSERLYLGNLFTLDAETLRSGQIDFSPTTIEIPAVELSNLNFVLMTKVFVFDDFILHERESSITHPWILPGLQKIQSGEKYEFQYVLDNNPHFEFKKI